MISDNANRLLLVKDMDVAAYPHQLLIDQNKNEFIGSLLPTCNIISTEVLIKTNFEEPFHEHPSCAFWSPLNCSEFTFEIIKSKLQDIFATYNFALNKQNIPDRPIDAEINIACAHGGADISDTQWFYADDEPIVETNKIIGKGKLLILLFVIHGSFTRPDYDNAMHTLIKRYIRVGYSSVIAPMWSFEYRNFTHLVIYIYEGSDKWSVCHRCFISSKHGCKGGIYLSRSICLPPPFW